jgi:hypothetical protein
MTDDRIEVMQAVLRGEISAEHVTLEEIRELEECIMDAIIEKRAQFNPAVFSGMDAETVH